MKRACLLILFVLIGCRKPANTSPPEAAKEEVASEQPADAAPAPRRPEASRATPSAASAPASASSETLVGAVHPFMTGQLRIFVRDKGRLPQNFTEFTSARMDSIPRAPEGFAWAIDEKTLEVKLVRERR